MKLFVEVYIHKKPPARIHIAGYGMRQYIAHHVGYTDSARRDADKLCRFGFKQEEEPSHYFQSEYSDFSVIRLAELPR